MTQDGKAAYLPKSDLGQYDASRAPAPELPDTVEGAAKVIDTATLSVGDQTVSLSGLHGEGGTYAHGLQSIINAQGRDVTCALQGATYRCRLQNGLDIAREALFNGAAEPDDGASEDYRNQADAARTAWRGVWRNQ